MATYFAQGKHRARVSECALVKSKNPNAQTGQHTDQARFTLPLSGVYEKGVLYECDPGRYPPEIYLAITPATMGTADQPGWVAATLAALGFDGDFDNLGQFVGVEVDIYNQHTKNKENEDRDSWSFDVPRERTTKASESKEIRSLKAQYGKLFTGNAARPRPVTPAADENPAPTSMLPATGGDIPF